MTRYQRDKLKEGAREMKWMPREIFNYADRFATRSEVKGMGTQYPTFRQIQKRFRITYDQIEEAVADSQGLDEAAYFGVAIGVGISGVGYYEHNSRGEYLVEVERKAGS